MAAVSCSLCHPLPPARQRPPDRQPLCRTQHVDVNLIEVMKAGAYFYKHDYGRAKRGRKWLVLSNDGLSLKWRSVGNTEVVQPGDGSAASSRGGTSSRGSFGGGSSARGLMKSASFSRFSSGARQTPPSPDQTTRSRACAAARPLLRLAWLHLTLPRAHSWQSPSPTSHTSFTARTPTPSRRSRRTTASTTGGSASLWCCASHARSTWPWRRRAAYSRGCWGCSSSSSTSRPTRPTSRSAGRYRSCSCRSCGSRCRARVTARPRVNNTDGHPGLGPGPRALA